MTCAEMDGYGKSKIQMVFRLENQVIYSFFVNNNYIYLNIGKSIRKNRHVAPPYIAGSDKTNIFYGRHHKKIMVKELMKSD